jgi:hypothetical protein
MARFAAIAAAVFAALAALPASADIGVTLLTTSTRAGNIARLRAQAGMPLFLVTASRAPRPYRCGHNAICAPRSIGPPTGWPYVRLRQLSRTNAGVIRFVVPALVPGDYRAVVYCEPCYRGRAGSLVVSSNRLTVHR